MSPAWILRCRAYGWAMFKENMLAPTPRLKAAARPSPRQWPSDRLTACWLGHSTVLLNFYGTTILTDPLLGGRMGPSLFGVNVGMRRISELPVGLDQLPPVDLVLLSHAHHDHWDIPTLKCFNGNARRLVIPRGTIDLLPQASAGRGCELDWGQTLQAGKLTIQAVQVEHWGQRMGSLPRHRSYNGYVISDGRRRVFFGGDTCFRDKSTGGDVDWAARVGGPIDLAILPIGDYIYNWNHISPEQAWSIFGQIGGRFFMPTHWRTFVMSPRALLPVFRPLEDLQRAAGSDFDKVVCRRPGEVFVLPE